ncbi:MAG: class I SAM-dependent methyltransferase [Spirosomataceae bacterium]
MNQPKEHLTNCPICQHTVFSTFTTCNDYTVSQEEFSIVRCKKCGFAFTNPRPTEDTIGAYYQSENYISHSNTKKGIIDKVYHLVRNYTLKSKLQLINSLESDGNQLLDIGCGTGMFLKICKTNGWNVTGVEPDSGARTLAIANVINSNIESEIWKLDPTKKYDIITMWHVLEHVHQLEKYLAWLSNHLNPNGKVLIAVPNLESWDAKKYQRYWAAYDVPRHLYHFNQANIKDLLELSNFKIEKTLPMYFDSFYVSMLSTKYRDGKINYVEAFLNGLKSNWHARSTTEYSSLIYIASLNQ